MCFHTIIAIFKIKKSIKHMLKDRSYWSSHSKYQIMSIIRYFSKKTQQQQKKSLLNQSSSSLHKKESNRGKRYQSILHVNCEKDGNKQRVQWPPKKQKYCNLVISLKERNHVEKWLSWTVFFLFPLFPQSRHYYLLYIFYFIQYTYTRHFTQ